MKFYQLLKFLVEVKHALKSTVHMMHNYMQSVYLSCSETTEVTFYFNKLLFFIRFDIILSVRTIVAQIQAF